MSFNVGDTVYVNTNYLLAAKAEVTEISKLDEEQTYYKVHLTDILGSMHCTDKIMYKTEALALEAKKKEDDVFYAKYMKEMETMEGVVKFPLKHCLVGEEYTDFVARRAYEDKLKSLGYTIGD